MNPLKISLVEKKIKSYPQGKLSLHQLILTSQTFRLMPGSIYETQEKKKIAQCVGSTINQSTRFSSYIKHFTEDPKIPMHL
jgi:virulence-associated protein VapD